MNEIAASPINASHKKEHLMRKTWIIAILLVVGGCTGAEDEPTPPPSEPSQSQEQAETSDASPESDEASKASTTPPEPAAEEPATEEQLIAEVEAAIEQKFLDWLTGEDHDINFQGVELRRTTLLDYEIRAVVPFGDGDVPRFRVVSTIELEGAGAQSVKRQIQHRTYQREDGEWRFSEF